LVKHLVALIEDKDLAAVKTKVLVSNESVQSTRSGDNDVRMGLLVLQYFGIFLNRGSSVEDRRDHIGHILAEACILILDLVGKLTSVAHNQNRCLASDWLNLLKGGKDEDGGFTKTGFRLAKDVGTKDGLRDTFLLDCRVNRAEVRKVLEVIMRCKCPQRPSIFAVRTPQQNRPQGKAIEAKLQFA
jgi:hypothetical protein